MNFKRFLLITFFAILLSGCDKSIETFFGTHCRRISFSTQKTLFKSENDGSFTFQMEESADKSSGALLIGNFSEVQLGDSDLCFETDVIENRFMNTLYLFKRNDGSQEGYYFADSGKIYVEHLYYSTKGNIDFMQGYLYRLVFVNIDGECKVVERIDFTFY